MEQSCSGHGSQEASRERGRSQRERCALPGHGSSRASSSQAPPPNSTFSRGTLLIQSPPKCPTSGYMSAWRDILDLNLNTPHFGGGRVTFCSEAGSHYIAQGGLKLLGPSDPSTAACRSKDRDTHRCTWLTEYVLKVHS